MRERLPGIFATMAFVCFFSLAFVACRGGTSNMPPEFSITIGAVTGGSVTTSHVDAVADTVVSINLIPHAEFFFGSLAVVGSDYGDAIETRPVGDSNYEWTFVMLAKDVTITAVFVQQMYEITLAPYGFGIIEASPAQAGLGMTVTLTLTAQEGYRYESGTLAVATTEGETVISAAPVAGDLVRYSFVMPAEPVTVTATFEERPFFAITLNDVPHGQLAATGAAENDAGEMQEGSLVTVTLTVDQGWRFQQDSLSITAGEYEDLYDLDFTEVEDEALTWTFVMPEAPVTVSAGTSNLFFVIIEDTSAELMFAGYESEEDGVFAVRAGTELTLSATPLPGFRLDNSRLPRAEGYEVEFASAGIRTWTFAMPGADIALGVNYDPLGRLVMYSGGAQLGLEIDWINGPGGIGSAWATWPDPAYTTTLHHYGAGRGDNLRGIRLTSPDLRPGELDDEISFSLRFTEPFEVDAREIVALSFWARTENAATPIGIFFAGFGNGDTRVAVGNMPAPPTPPIVVTDQWQQFIVPVPSALPETFSMNDVFFARFGRAGSGLGNLVEGGGNAIFFDDIEFLTSGMEVTEVVLPEAFGSLLTNLDPVNPATLVTTANIVYAHADGASVVLRDLDVGGLGRYFIWSAWFGEMEVELYGGQATVNEAGWIVPDGLSAVFYVRARVSGVWSNPMRLEVVDRLMVVLGDWSPPNPGWAPFDTSTSWTFLRPGGEAVHVGQPSRSILLAVAPRDEDVTGLATGNILFDAPRNISFADIIEFRIRQSRLHVGSNIEGATIRFYLRNGTGAGETWHGVALDLPYAAAAPLPPITDARLPLGLFGGADLTAVTGFRFTLTRGEISIADVLAVAAE